MQVVYLDGNLKTLLTGMNQKSSKKLLKEFWIDCSPLIDVDEDLVGMTTRLQDLKSRLKIGSGGVRMVGIWGIGGSGKTTLASSLYKKISHTFQGHCIIDNIRVESSKPAGLKALQQDILSRVLKTQRQVQSVEEGKGLIKSRLCESNVLVLLDDVNDLDQLEALAGSHNWFGSGSRIVITTRDEHLLRTHNVDEVYRVKLLSEDEAIHLFNKRAFKQENTPEGYETLSSSAVSYAVGLPLALKVLGSFLYDKDKNEWKSALDKLKGIPDLKVMDILKTSYEGLETYQKELFLDIACFWRRKPTYEAITILEACNFYPQIGITVLRQKALITIVDGWFDLHDLIEEMGHYIVRGEHPNTPEKYSRLWKDEEINDICCGGATMENDNIQAIRFDDLPSDHDLSRFCEIVSNLKKLRWLSVTFNHPKFEDVGGPIFLSNDLRYIKWKGYPATSLPNNFQPQKLVALVLSHSMQKQVWKGCKRLPLLKVLKLKGMEELLSTPNFDGLPSLQNLELIHCDKLKEIHPSLGNHTSLEHIKIDTCPKLKRFPAIFNMKNLKKLEMVSCPKILEFPDIHENMENLIKLTLKETGIKVLPSSTWEYCANLVSLSLFYLHNLKSIQFNYDDFKHLKRLKLVGLIQLKKTRRHSFPQFLDSMRKLDLGHFKDVEISSAVIGELSKLQVLDLSGNDFSRLNFSLSQLSELKFLNVSHCEQLIELPKLPSNLAILMAKSCKSLVFTEDSYTNCKWLCQVSLLGGCIINGSDRLLQFMLEGKHVESGCMILQLGNLDIAKGFTPPLTRKGRCRLQLRENWCNDFSGFLMCVAVNLKCCGPSVCIIMKEEASGIDSQDDVVWEGKDGDDDMRATWVGYVSFALLRESEWWDQEHKAISFTIDNINCSGFGVRLVAKTSRSGLTETETSTHSSSNYYTPIFKIKRDSKSDLMITLKTRSQYF